MYQLDIPESLKEKIEGRYLSSTDQLNRCADYYVNCHPDASWEHFTRMLCIVDELEAARLSKSFMTTGKYCH